MLQFVVTAIVINRRLLRILPFCAGSVSVESWVLLSIESVCASFLNAFCQQWSLRLGTPSYDD
jgi:hypothetical protein